MVMVPVSIPQTFLFSICKVLEIVWSSMLDLFVSDGILAMSQMTFNQ